jgi:glycosyltransferase involved in cell wall biosynthesis
MASRADNNDMRIAIDASNIRVGGGLTHLVELLREADAERHGFERIIVWARRSVLDKLDDRPWLDKRTDPVLERNFVKRAIWQRHHLGKLAEAAGADLLFVPGGAVVAQFKPVVTMSRNMLPFEWRELRRFGLSSTALKLLLLRFTQSSSFRRADGTIFLTRYAFDVTRRIVGPLRGQTAIVPHGTTQRFRQPPRPARRIEEVTASDPMRIAYVSVVDVYKHHWNLAEAVAKLRAEGLPVRLDLYGAARPSVLPRLTATLDRLDPSGGSIRYWGSVDYKELEKRYAAAEIFAFPSSCENMPNILVESMASGLPIASSKLGPMPEILGDAGVYFDPDSVDDIAAALKQLILDPNLRETMSAAAFASSAQYTWRRCADQTLQFLKDVHSAKV